MFFQEATPDTSGYMIAGYAITFIVIALYVVSMYLRSRNLNQDMTTLQELDKPAPPLQTAPKSQPKKAPAKPQNNKSAKSVTKKSRKNKP
jgi:CcmD family protein